MRFAAGRRAVIVAVVVTVVALPLVLRNLASAQLAPPPPTPVDGSPSTFPTALTTPANERRPPSLTAPTALLADLDTGQVLFAKAPTTRRPIASVTKIMTALLVLERTRMTDVVLVDPAAVFADDDYGANSTLGLRAGERLSVEDLLYGLLLGSANDAAEALAIHVGGSKEAFVELMNRRARRLDMNDTVFFSPDGLDDRGRSTVRDLLTLTRAARALPAFDAITATRFHRIPAPEGLDRRIQNRNVLLWLYPGATGIKTGSTARAGACLVATAGRDGRSLAAIVLGEPDGAFDDAAALLNYGFDGFGSRTLVAEGEDLGIVAIRGGQVPVQTAAELTRLVPSSDAIVQRRIVVDPRAAFPPAPGDRVGTLRVLVDGRPVGAVGMVVRLVPDPEADGGPWWASSVGAVARAVAGAATSLAD